MRILAAFALLFALSCSPAAAAGRALDTPAYPDTAGSMKNRQSRMGFNRGFYRESEKEQETAFPQGKNFYQASRSAVPATRTIPSSSKGRKPICVGPDCGCGAGKAN